MHVLGVGVVELAVAQLTEEGDQFSSAVERLLDILVAHGLYGLLSRQ